MQDFLKMYSNLVERCFTACCNDFTSKALSSKEVRHNALRHIRHVQLNAVVRNNVCHIARTSF